MIIQEHFRIYFLTLIHLNFVKIPSKEEIQTFIIKEARKLGLSLIVEDGVAKMKLGIVSLAEIIRITALKE